MNFKVLSFFAITAVSSAATNLDGPFAQQACVAELNGPLAQSNQAMPLKCFIKSKKGMCKGELETYHYDHEQGCTKGAFGGCPDGCNTFQTLDECHSTCTRVDHLMPNPAPAQFETKNCKLEYPKDPKPIHKNLPAKCFIATKEGKCKMGFVSFHYDAAKNTCVESKFGGCEDGCQAYKTKDECEKDCHWVSIDV